MRPLLTLLFLCTVLFTGQAQKNYFEIGLGRGFLSSGDGRSWSFTNEYRRAIGKGRFLFGGGLSVHYSYGDLTGINVIHDDLSQRPFALIDQHNTYPFPDLVPGEPFSRQNGKILNTATSEDIYINLDLFAIVRLLSLEETNKWEWNLSFGPVINYSSQSYIAQTVSGVFVTPFYPDTGLTMVMPYYKRLLTVGASLESEVLRQISQKSAIGLAGRAFLNINGDAVYNYTVVWRIGF